MFEGADKQYGQGDFDFEKYGYKKKSHVVGGRIVNRYYKPKRVISIKKLVKKLKHSNFPLDDQKMSLVKEVCKTFTK